MRQFLSLVLEGAEVICVPLLGIVLWSIRPVLFALAVLAGFAAGFGLAVAVH